MKLFYLSILVFLIQFFSIEICVAQGSVNSNSIKIHVSTWDMQYDNGSGMSDESFKATKLKQILPSYISYKSYKKAKKYYSKKYKSTKNNLYVVKQDSISLLMDAYVVFNRAFDYIDAGNKQSAKSEFGVLSNLKFKDYNTALFYAEYMRKNDFLVESATLYKQILTIPKKYDYVTAARFGKMFYDNFNDIDKSLATEIFSKIIEDSNYKIQPYEEKLKIIDLVTSCQSSDVALILLNDLSVDKNINNIDQYCIVGKYFNDNGRSDLAHNMFSKILQTSELSSKNYKEQLNIGAFVADNGDNETAYSIFKIVSNNKAITEVKDIYEVAKVFEKKGFYELSLNMYGKITEYEYGLSAYLLGQISIADIYYNYPNYDPDAVAFLMYQEICYTETNDEKIYPILYKACSQTSVALNTEINNLIPEYERYVRKMKRKQNVKSGLNVLTEVVSVAAELAPTYGVDASVATDLANIATISTAVNTLVQDALSSGITANDYSRLSIKDKMDFDKELIEELQKRIYSLEPYK